MKTEAVDKKIEALDEEEEGEDLDELRRKYLLRRFWHTASRFWTDPKSHMAWLLSGMLLVIILLNLAAAYAMNQWNRSIFDALEKKEASTVLNLSMVYLVILVISVAFAIVHVYARMTLQRRWRKWLTEHPGRPLAEVRPLLPAQPGQRRPQEPGIPHRRRRPDRDRIPRRLRQRRHFGVPLGGDVHRRALDHRRRAEHHHRRHRTLHPRLPGDRRGDLRGDRQRRDDADRPPLRHRLRKQEPVRGRAALRADAAARERREHRAAFRARRRSAPASIARSARCCWRGARSAAST